MTVLLNAKAGSADDETKVREALAGTSLEATIVRCEAAPLTAAARRVWDGRAFIDGPSKIYRRRRARPLPEFARVQ